MKQRILLIILALAAGMTPMAALEGGFVAAGGEVNANTRAGSALGGGAAVGLDLSAHLALGLRTLYSSNLDTVGALEPSLFFRLYLPLADFDRGASRPFVQADAGVVVLFEDSQPYAAVMGGITAGWRFNLGRSFYLEPAVRGGYPFAWGAGLYTGLYFKHGNKE